MTMMDGSSTTAPSYDDIAYDGNAIQHDNDAPSDDAIDDMIAGAQFTADETPLPGDDEENPFDDFLNSERPEFDEPDAALLEPKKRTPKARKYERKVAGLFSIGVKLTIESEKMVPDAAAMLMFGPDIAQATGDLCAVNERAARIIDAITDQTENPATALMMVGVPFVLQVLRNHEPVMERDNGRRPRVLKIPFTKRQLRFRVGIRLGNRMRNMTNDPVALKRHVFTNPQIISSLQKQGIKNPVVK
jgi:hypothetical protein